jgi:hypothetical protein
MSVNPVSAPFFRGHTVRAITDGPDGLVLWMRRGHDEPATGLTLTAAAAARGAAPEGALRDELSDAIAVCEAWRRANPVPRPGAHKS